MLRLIVWLAMGLFASTCATASAAVRIEGQVRAGTGAAANSTVTLWAATANEPRALAQAKSNSDGGYVGGGLQMQTDLAIGPAGDVWVMNNWQDIDSCFGVPQEAVSTRCGGQGVTVFFGVAKPVRAPQIGPARAP
jgi:hypothetical protein